MPEQRGGQLARMRRAQRLIADPGNAHEELGKPQSPRQKAVEKESSLALGSTDNGLREGARLRDELRPAQRLSGEEEKLASAEIATAEMVGPVYPGVDGAAQRRLDVPADRRRVENPDATQPRNADSSRAVAPGV